MSILKKISFIFILCLIFSTTVFAQNTIPQTVRVGLFYGSTAVNSADLSSSTGFNIGYYANDQFVSLFKSSLTSLSVNKDGSTHIQVGTTYANYAGACSVVSTFAAKNYDAYPVYDGTWKVWIGSYDSSTSANTTLTALKRAVSTYSYTVISPNASRVKVMAGTQTKLLFAYNNNFLQIAPSGTPNVIVVNGTTYRGAVQVRRISESDMTIINVVNIEQYLYSVVGTEMSSSWNIEALKAQAVAARTYAVKVLLNVKAGKGAYIGYGMDMNGTTEFQAYKGYSREAANTIAAVDGTKGMVAYYNGEPIGAYFFSSDGGYTENSENVWVSALPYLRSVEDNYQPAEFNKKTWSNTATPEEIKTYFASKGLDIGDITDVKVTSYSTAGNALCLRITGTKGVKEYTKDNIRMFMRGVKGSEFLYSQTFTVTKSGGASTTLSAITRRLTWIKVSMADARIVRRSGTSSLSGASSVSIRSRTSTNTVPLTSGPVTYTFNGRGWGHGVGMSQWGAKGMGDAGFTYDQILKHYYTGIEIK